MWEWMSYWELFGREKDVRARLMRVAVAVIFVYGSRRPIEVLTSIRNA